jgi:hypothetical protein
MLGIDLYLNNKYHLSKLLPFDVYPDPTEATDREQMELHQNQLSITC